MDVIKILEVLSEQDLIRLNRPIGRYYSIYCPFHNGGQERKPSFGVLIHEEVRNGQIYPEGFCHCFACGYVNSLPNMISEILKSKNISSSGKDWLIANIPGFDETSIDFDYLLSPELMHQLQNSYAVETLKSRSISTSPTYVSDFELSKYRLVVDYMYDRGLTDEIIQQYDVGVDLNFIPEGRKRPVPCITFPVRDITGGTLFIVRRSISGKAFYLPRDVEKPVYGMYELPPHSKQVVITESCFNALTCIKYGIPSVALLGTGTPYQIQQLRSLGVSEYILGLDPDYAGDVGCNRLRRGLKDVAILRRLPIPEGKDINDLSKDQFDEAMSNLI